MATPDEIAAHCRSSLSETEIERLTCWIAWRQGRNQALAGDRSPSERLRHATTNWLSAQERALLLAWMRRRRERGLPEVPR